LFKLLDRILSHQEKEVDSEVEEVTATAVVGQAMVAVATVVEGMVTAAVAMAVEEVMVMGMEEEDMVEIEEVAMVATVVTEEAATVDMEVVEGTTMDTAEEVEEDILAEVAEEDTVITEEAVTVVVSQMMDTEEVVDQIAALVLVAVDVLKIESIEAAVIDMNVNLEERKEVGTADLHPDLQSEETDLDHQVYKKTLVKCLSGAPLYHKK